ncbi:MAG TPA: hypothetical protein VF786_15815, partial [Terriglobales bacterium]
MGTDVTTPSVVSTTRVETVHTQLEFVRFSRKNRALHACMVISFLSLALTGLTLKFSYTSWAVVVSH